MSQQRQIKSVIFGGHGFIGHHFARKLKSMGHYVVTVDIKKFQYGKLDIDQKRIVDLRDPKKVNKLFKDLGEIDYIYAFRRNMGGRFFVFSGDNDSQIMHDSRIINLNVREAIKNYRPNAKLVYSSSRCVYPEQNQLDPTNPNCEEKSAWPAHPDSKYGIEKLFSEQLYMAYKKNHNLKTYIVRYHNIFGPECRYVGGRQKSPAAMCRKAVECKLSGKKQMQVWGPGTQTRSFLYIDECIDGVLKLVAQDEFHGPVNIGSEEMISINDLAKMTLDIAGVKDVVIKNIEGPLGVMGRNSDNKLIKQKLGWAPSRPLRQGMQKTYRWIEKQVKKATRKASKVSR